MAGLEYIVIGKIPEAEARCIRENLAGDGAAWRLISAEDAREGAVEAARGAMAEDAQGAETADARGAMAKNARGAMATPISADNCILVSGDAAELGEAASRGVAAVAFESPGSRGGGDIDGGEQGDAAPLEADIIAQGFGETGLSFFVRAFQRHHNLPWTILKTERCVVREITLGDLDDLFELYAGEGMTEYIDPLFPYETERAYQSAYIENMYRFYGYGMWVVTDRGTGKMIGRVGIECREELGGVMELGYVIGKPYQRQGYATEVCSAILSYARDELGIREIFCFIDEGNEVSEIVARKLGFSLVDVAMIGGKRMLRYRLEIAP